MRAPIVATMAQHRRIDASNPDELRRCAVQLGVTPERLRAAIAKVGDHADAVATYLQGGRLGPLAARQRPGAFTRR